MKSPQVLQDALARARMGAFQQALAMFDAGLQEAERRGDDNQSVCLLAMNAAIVADQCGDLLKAEHYYRLALRMNETDPQTHFALADVLKREGKSELATKRLNRCFDLAMASNDVNALELLEAVGFKKPG